MRPPTCVASKDRLLPVWVLLGLGNGLVLTPSGRLLRRSAHTGDRPALFAAQFALSHACWLLTYPLAGGLGAALGLGPTFLILAGLVALGVAGAALLWPEADPEELDHDHADLPTGRPYRQAAHATPAADAPGFRHRHAYVIHEFYRRWPHV